MLSADTDYARAVAHLSRAHLTPYVAYVAHDSVNGLGNASQTDRVVVRVSDGKIVAGRSNITIEGKIFDPTCYRATGETQTTFEGTPAIKLDLVATCPEKHSGDHNYAIRTLYADPQTLVPIDANGTILSGSNSNNVGVSVDERFATFDGHVMPSSIKVDVSGTGIMFWLQVHVRETYSGYQFLNSPSA
jgi:uncharacterized Zn-binding protein involved in type VI secretion